MFLLPNNFNNMFEGTSSLLDENKCAIHSSFSSNVNWPYDWSILCSIYGCTDATSFNS